MHLLAQVPFAQVELHWDQALPGGGEPRARQLRGALANAFRDDDLFHQHDPVTGKPLYRYPRVQYRWRDGHGRVVGWSEAAARLLNLPWLDLELELGADTARVSDAALTLTPARFGVSDGLLAYRLVTPALLFNQDNYRRYRELDEAGQRRERDRLLVANLLMALRGLDVHFPERLYGAFSHPRAQTCHYKGEAILGLGGEFLSNAVLPEGFALGHAVSHGYGVLQST